MLPASQSSTSYTEEPLASRSPFHHKEGEEDKSNKKCQESNYILLGRPFKIHIESPPAVLVDFRSRKHLVTEAEVSLDYLTCPSLFHSPKGASVASAVKEQPTQLVFLVYSPRSKQYARGATTLFSFSLLSRDILLLPNAGAVKILLQQLLLLFRDGCTIILAYLESHEVGSATGSLNPT